MFSFYCIVTNLSLLLVVANEMGYGSNNVAEESGSNYGGVQTDDDDIQPGDDDIQPGGDYLQPGNDGIWPDGDGLQPNDEDIRREYHPNSHRETEIFSFDAYQSIPPVVIPPVEPEPWLPFKTREDFEFAEIALATAMTKAQIDATIGLLHRCIDKGKGSFTLSNHDEMRKTLKVASDRLPKVRWFTVVSLLCSPDHTFLQFEKKMISPEYKGQPRTFDVWVRPIWEWIESMLQDPQLIHHFVWDACKMSKFDGQSSSWVRFYDEPWTAARFWEIQVCMICWTRFSKLN